MPSAARPCAGPRCADGQILTWTVFVSGDSYLSAGFSTRRPPTDANFWGVSSAQDDNSFYATMATGD